MEPFEKLIVNTIKTESMRFRKLSNSCSPNYYFYQVVQYMIQNNLSSIVDLGSGHGHVLEICRRLGWKVKGYEIDPLIVREAYDFVELKDVENIEEDHIYCFDMIYMYGPFMDDKKNIDFAEKIKSKMSPGQYFMYRTVNSKKHNIFVNE